MLRLEGNTGPEQPGSFTKHKIFAPKRVAFTANPPSADPKAHAPRSGPDALRESPIDDNDNNDDNDDNDGNDDQRHDGNANISFGTLPPLLTNDALAQAISSHRMATQVQKWKINPIAMDILKLFALLVEPPPRFDLDSIPGIDGYLTTLCNAILNLPVNGVCFFATHCLWVLRGECSTSAHTHKSGRSSRALLHGR